MPSAGTAQRRWLGGSTFSANQRANNTLNANLARPSRRTRCGGRPPTSAWCSTGSGGHRAGLVIGTNRAGDRPAACLTPAGQIPKFQNRALKADHEPVVGQSTSQYYPGSSPGGSLFATPRNGSGGIGGSRTQNQGPWTFSVRPQPAGITDARGPDHQSLALPCGTIHLRAWPLAASRKRGPRQQQFAYMASSRTNRHRPATPGTLGTASSRIASSRANADRTYGLQRAAVWALPAAIRPRPSQNNRQNMAFDQANERERGRAGRLRLPVSADRASPGLSPDQLGTGRQSGPAGDGFRAAPSGVQQTLIRPAMDTVRDQQVAAAAQAKA